MTRQGLNKLDLHGLCGFFGLPEPEWFDLESEGDVRAEWRALETSLIIDLFANGAVETFVKTLTETHDDTLPMYHAMRLFAIDFHKLVKEHEQIKEMRQ